ncbi:BatA domain-containing protein [Botrimarina hoheduenensis]|uniref:Aerotolerance regulator N-terminal domain-containing protein n=1 Tax=Botrimarina hoheduenensis TaxID=2528000 RepID=A0A5C5W7N3_9BACT|nr:BatA domain-containing protein [Botrimarina hoheduenensis]TWT46457.1 hypothetical protein Pla111_15530 [Botrimarina hoheduenensis]
MTFLTPALLAGTLFIGVPILLHLARRREPRRLAFPALRLLEKTRRKQETHLRLRRLLLLALRCAAIALLALALARPLLTPKLPAEANETEAPTAPAPAPATAAGTGLAMALVFDNGPNMGYRLGGVTRLAAASEVAEWMLSRTPPETPTLVVDRTQGARPAVSDVGVAATRVDRLHIAAAVRSLTDTIGSALVAMAATPAGRREVFVFTDLSFASLDTASQESLAALLQQHPEITLRIVDVGAPEPRNAGVAAVETPSATLLAGQSLQLETTLEIVGDPPDKAVLRLWLDAPEGPLKRDERPLPETAADNGPITFTLNGLPEGTHTGYVQLVTADGLPADDTRYFAVRVIRPSTVWLVANDPSRAVFVEEAITVTESAAGVTCRNMLSSDFATDRQLADLLRAGPGAVLLLDPAPFSGSVWRRLADYATAGGGVGVFLGGAANLTELNGADAQTVLPAKLRWRSRERTYLRPIDYQHPALAPLAPYAASLPWSAFPIFERWEIETPASDAETVATYADGSAAIVGRQVGRGRVLMMTTPVSDPASGDAVPWNLLPTGDDPWPFLLLAQSLVDYLAAEPAPPLTYTAGATASVALPPGAEAGGFLVRLPRGESVRQTPLPGAGSLAVRMTDEAGVYRVATSAGGTPVEQRFVVNLAPGSGRLERIDQAELIERIGSDRIEIVRDREALARSIDRGRVGRELYGVVLAMAVLALVGEQFVSNRFYRSAREAAS